MAGFDGLMGLLGGGLGGAIGGGGAGMGLLGGTMPDMMGDDGQMSPDMLKFLMGLGPSLMGAKSKPLQQGVGLLAAPILSQNQQWMRG